MIGHIITRKDNPTIEASKQVTGSKCIRVYTKDAAEWWLKKGFTPEQSELHKIEPVRLTLIREEIENGKRKYPEQGCNQGCGICRETEERSAEEICNPEPVQRAEMRDGMLPRRKGKVI